MEILGGGGGEQTATLADTHTSHTTVIDGIICKLHHGCVTSHAID